MYNKQLETFLKVAETGSFSRSAAELYVSPSAVIQQMNHLEADLQVTLFNRTRQGIELTEAGKFLKKEASSYIQSGQEIRSQLQHIASGAGSICVGTSLKHKIRLLYDLWVLFSRTGKDYTIRLVNTDNGSEHIGEAELIECIYADLPWQKDWKFLKICDVPMGCGVSKHHALADRHHLSVGDLKNMTMFSIRHGNAQKWEWLQKELRQQDIILREVPQFDGTVMWECACQQSAIMAPLCWNDILFDTVLLPCDWPYQLPYGFCYREQHSRAVQEFLDFVREVYHGETWAGAVPVF